MFFSPFFLPLDPLYSLPIDLQAQVLGIDGLLDGPWSEEFGQPPGSIGVEHEVSTPVIRNRLTGEMGDRGWLDGQRHSSSFESF